MNIYYYLINMGPLLVLLIGFAIAEGVRNARHKKAA
jgi:hypothetical protein